MVFHLPDFQYRFAQAEVESDVEHAEIGLANDKPRVDWST